MKIEMNPVPVDSLAAVSAYSPPRSLCPTDLGLAGNEGREPDPALLQALAEAGTENLRRYPNRGPLEARLAEMLGITPTGVLVTAGADDALDRVCRAFLNASRHLIVAVPTFEMIPRYASLAGAGIREVSWPSGAFPVDEILAQIDETTSVIALVSPNNPTGAVVSAEDLIRLSGAAPHSLLLVDLAYGEFADTDLTPTALALPNAVVARSFSKAWGLAGLRVGYVAGEESLITPLRAAGGPYAVSGPSLLLAERALLRPEDIDGFVDRVRYERGVLRDDLEELGAEPVPSQGNFVYARYRDAAWTRDGLAGLGIAVRLFEGSEADRIRISCPGEEVAFTRLRESLRTVLAPEALLFDMDGVLADVSGSYRRAIQETARAFGREITTGEIAAAKRQPGSNNDWVLTQGLLADRGVNVGLKEVVAVFEEIYQALSAGEALIPGRDLLERLAARLPLAVVTGRPRTDAEKFMDRQGIGDLFAATVCLEDGPGKPDPALVRLAIEQLGVRRAWLVGDTVNDIIAARAADVLPLGVVPPGEDYAGYPDLLLEAGAGRILNQLSDLEEVLPR